MKLDYITLLSPNNIKLAVGTIKKPTLREIGEITFQRFYLYEFFLKLTPRLYFCKVLKDFGGAEKWESMSSEAKNIMKVFDLVKRDRSLQELYSEIFSFFFLEKVAYVDEAFVLNIIRDGVDVRVGAIDSDTFVEAVEILQQLCCIYEEEVKKEEMVFKNEATRLLYERMQAAQAEKEKDEKDDGNGIFSLPNVISSLSNRHTSINPVNVWELTIFQLYDSFERLRVNEAYGISATRVSVWGDEKNTFDATLWYKEKK